MRPGALVHLLFRPVLLLWGLYLLGLLTVVDRALMARPDLLPYVLALGAGLLAGQAVQELQHTTLAWMLPRLPRRLLLEMLAAGAMVSLVAALWGRALGAALGLGPLAALAFLGFSLGSVLIDPLARRASWLSWLAAVGVGAWGWSGPRPVFVVLAATAGAGLCFHRAFSRRTFRARPFLPTVALLSSLYPDNQKRYAREKLARRRRERAWREPRQPGGLRGRLAAAFLEGGGPGALGWWGAALGNAFGWPLVLLGLSLVVAVKDGEGLVAGLEAYAREVFGAAPMLAFWFGLSGLSLLWNRPPLLTAAHLLPLSRRQRAGVNQAGGALGLAAWALLTGVGFSATALAAVLATGSAGPGLRGLSLLEPLALAAVLLPLVQWLRLVRDADLAARRGAISHPVTQTVLGASFLLALNLVYAAWRKGWGPEAGVAAAVVLAASLVLSQLLFGRAVRRHYRWRDLV